MNKLNILLLVCLASLAACDASDPAAGLLSEARSAFQARDFQHARESVQALLQTAPDNGDARLLLGRIYLEQENYRAAEIQFRRARRTQPPPAGCNEGLLKALLLQEKYDDVLRETGSPRETAGEDYVRLARGDALLGKGDIAKATASFQQILDDAPDNVDAHLGLARIALSQENTELALQHIAYGIPLVTDALYLQGLAYTLAEDFDAAAESFRAVVKRRADNIAALLGLARALVANEKFTEAGPVLDKVLLEDPTNVTAHHLRSLAALIDSDIDKTIAHAREALSQDPDYIPSLAIIGTAHFLRDELQHAATYLSRYIKAEPQDREIRKTLAVTYLRLGLPDETLWALRPLLSRDTHDADVSRLSAAAYLGTQQYARAIQQYAALSADDERDSESLALLTRILEGDEADLRETFSRYLADTEYGDRLAHESGDKFETDLRAEQLKMLAALDNLNSLHTQRGRYDDTADEQRSRGDGISYFECERGIQSGEHCQNFSNEVESILKTLGRISGGNLPATRAAKGSGNASISSRPIDLVPRVKRATVTRTIQKQANQFIDNQQAMTRTRSSMLRVDVRHAPKHIVKTRNEVGTALQNAFTDTDSTLSRDASHIQSHEFKRVTEDSTLGRFLSGVLSTTIAMVAAIASFLATWWILPALAIGAYLIWLWRKSKAGKSTRPRA